MADTSADLFHSKGGGGDRPEEASPYIIIMSIAGVSLVRTKKIVFLIGYEFHI